MIVVPFQVTMGIPVVVVVGATGIELNEANAPLNETTSHEALAPEILRLPFVHAVEFFDMLGLGFQLNGIRRSRLHPIGQFITRNPRRKITLASTHSKMLAVHQVNVIDQGALLILRHTVGVLEIENGIPFRTKNRSRVARRHVSR